MARFPKSEAAVRALAQSMIAGFPENPHFPSPPVPMEELEGLLAVFIERSNAQVAAQAAAEQATDAKQEAFEDLTLAMKSDLRYAENAVRGDDAKLGTIGWGGKSEPTPLRPPGQPRLLEAPKQGAGWLRLDWKAPAEGGAPAFYRVERRRLPAGDWEVAGMSMEIETTLHNQQRRVEWEYRVIAVNKAGEGEPSNTAAAVL